MGVAVHDMVVDPAIQWKAGAGRRRRHGVGFARYPEECRYGIAPGSARPGCPKSTPWIHGHGWSPKHVGVSLQTSGIAPRASATSASWTPHRLSVQESPAACDSRVQWPPTLKRVPRESNHARISQ